MALESYKMLYAVPKVLEKKFNGTVASVLTHTCDNP